MNIWCENELFIFGKKEELERFMEVAQGKNGCLDMNSFIPYPIELQNQDEICRVFREEIEGHNRALMEKIKQMSQEEKEQYRMENGESWGFKCSDSYNCDGCRWRLRNWGTKENFFAPLLVDEDLDEEIGFLYYEFETAWSPPEPVIKKMGAMFPELDFELRYFKADSGFNGILVIEHGEVEFEDCAAYYGHRGG